MTYLTFLIAFLGIPVALLTAVHVRERGRLPARLVGALVVVALVYTTPWDNYLVAQRVWWYDPARVLGVMFGYVPLEEYLFFVLQTVLASLWVLFLARRLPASGGNGRVPWLAPAGVALGAMLWLGAVGVLLTRVQTATYLALELAWALPPIVLQFAWGADILWRERRVVALALATLILYLCAADSLAIGAGTWTINPALSIVNLKVGVLPIEEVVFFTVTNVLIVYGLVLGLAPESRARLARRRAAILRGTANTRQTADDRRTVA